MQFNSADTSLTIAYSSSEAYVKKMKEYLPVQLLSLPLSPAFSSSLSLKMYVGVRTTVYVSR